MPDNNYPAAGQRQPAPERSSLLEYMKKADNINKTAYITVAAMLAAAMAITASIMYVKATARIDAGTGGSPWANAVYESKGSFTTPYGSFTPIEHVADVNKYMVENHRVLSFEDTLPYISSDPENADDVMARIAALSDEICGDAKNDKDRAERIAVWVGENVAYDYDAALDGSMLDIISLEAVLENGFRTTCGGFANLFSALCECQGIYTINMKGGTPSEGWTRRELESAPANHEWNAVLIDGKWFYSDPTWISDYSYKDGEYLDGENILSYYARFNFGEMCVEHRIDRCEHRQFLSGEAK